MRRDWNKETPEDKGRGEQTAMSRTHSETEGGEVGIKKHLRIKVEGSRLR